MSTRIYNLRTRTEVGQASQSYLQNESTHRRLSPSPARDPPPHMVGSRLLGGSPSALYSDVVASRSPSPVKETTTAHIGTLHCCVQYSSRNNYSVVYGRGSRNSVNPQMSLCPARVRFRESANVSPSSAGIPKRKRLFPKKETNAPVTKINCIFI